MILDRSDGDGDKRESKRARVEGEMKSLEQEQIKEDEVKEMK
jgi:hypothetical protein